MDLNAYHRAWLNGATESEAERAGEDAWEERAAYEAGERAYWERLTFENGPRIHEEAADWMRQMSDDEESEKEWERALTGRATGTEVPNT